MNTSIRYYVVSIEYNRDKGAENRTAPSAFDDYDSARAKLHAVLAQDINNPTLGWATVLMFDNAGAVLASEHWERSAN